MKQGLIVIVCIVLLVTGGIAWYLFEQRAVPEPPVAAVTEIEPEPAGAEVPEPEEPAFTVGERLSPPDTELATLPLPPLNESDAYARDGLASVVGEANAIQYFTSDALVARAVATIDALGSRQVPGNIKAVDGPVGAFSAVPDPNPPTVILNEAGDPMPQYLSDPANQKRYIAWVEMLEAVDAETFAALYQSNYPLFQQAWRAQGYTDGDFNARLLDVIDELLATPVAEEPYRLVKPEAVYLFADEELEALSAGQKILLRMGSENAARVKSSLAEIRQAIE